MVSVLFAQNASAKVVNISETPKKWEEFFSLYFRARLG